MKAGSNIEEAIRKWRADISMVETEMEEYVMPEKLFKALSLQSGVVNVLEISS